ncbi:MAG: DVUA0089 family protein, partial [Planctomycetales bacterium]|nr:DVUA0089 family protein [Planctomycetales bacterium]
MKKLGYVWCAVMMLSFIGTAQAALDFDFSGTFTKDNDIALLNFTVGSTSTVTVFSSSWVEGNTTGVPVHGFDPILAIWDSSGNLIEQQDDGGFSGQESSNGTLYDVGTWDSYYQVLLGPGTYTASIAQFDNFAAGSNLSDGFIHDSDPHFTTGWGPQADFNGVWDQPNDAR